MKLVAIALACILSTMTTKAVTARHSPGQGGEQPALDCGKSVENDAGVLVSVGCYCEVEQLATARLNPADWHPGPSGWLWTEVGLFNRNSCREELGDETGGMPVACTSHADCSNGGPRDQWTFQGHCPVFIAVWLVNPTEWPPY